MKMIVYVKTLEEAEQKKALFAGKNVEIVIVPCEVIKAFENKLEKQLEEKNKASLQAHNEFKKFNYSRESSKRSQLKMKLFGTYLVSDEDLEKLVVQLIKEEVASSKQNSN